MKLFILSLIAASAVHAQESPNVEKPAEQFPINVSASTGLDGAPTGGMDAGSSGGGQGAGGGIPTIDIARVIKEVLANMLLGSVLDPSTLLGKAYGILDMSMQKLNINLEELEQLSNIYETFGEALTIAAGDSQLGQYDFASTIAQNSDAQERVFQASLQQAKQLGLDPTQLMAMRELNNQNIRNVMFSETIKKVKQLSGQQMTWTQRMALQNILQQLNSDMLGQASLNALIAQSIKSMQSLEQSQDAKMGQQQINAILATGGKIDPNRDVEDYAPATPQTRGYYDYRGSEHVFFDDYKRALENLAASGQLANQGGQQGNLPPGDGSLVNSAYKMIGVSTANIAGTNNGNLGCAAAVSLMFKNATGQNILPGQSIVLGTGELYSGLSNDPRFVKVPLSQAQPGDIVVTARGSRPGHTGIVVNDGRIISNSSSGFNGSARGTIQNNYSIAKWQSSVTPRNPGQTAAFRYVGG